MPAPAAPSGTQPDGDAPAPLSSTPPSRSPAALNVLAFDTATERLAVGLQATGRRLHGAGPGGAVASTALLPLAAALLQEAGIGLGDLDFIAFGRGPGAFTGLRCSCAVAQGLGFGLDRPLLAIDSLAIVAEDARLQTGPVADGWTVGVAMDARMDEVYAAVYRWQGGGWQKVQEPALHGLPSLHAAWAGLALQAVAGSALAAFGERLALPPGARSHPVEGDRAVALLSLAVRAAAAGEGLDAAAGLPLYLRDKVASTIDERLAVRAAKSAP